MAQILGKPEVPRKPASYAAGELQGSSIHATCMRPIFCERFSAMIPRRSFIRGSAALAALGDFAFLSRLPAVSAADAVLEPRMVRFRPDIEPLVRLLEDTPRERVLEEVARRVKRGLSYREVLAALLLAGVRNIQPRPVGFKFHAVLVVNSAHLASLASPETDRWLPIFWAIDQFKTLAGRRRARGRLDDGAGGRSRGAAGAIARRQAFIEAMDNWDEAAADAAVVGLARTADARTSCSRSSAATARAISATSATRPSTSPTASAPWRSSAGSTPSRCCARWPTRCSNAPAPKNPANADLAADRPFRQNLEKLKRHPRRLARRQPDAGATQGIAAGHAQRFAVEDSSDLHGEAAQSGRRRRSRSSTRSSTAPASCSCRRRGSCRSTP